MAFFDFLGGGVLTVVLIVLALLVLWGVYKIVIAPFFSLFGWGKKNVGKLADRGMTNWVDSRTRERREQKREEQESAGEKQAKMVLNQAGDATANMGNLLTNVAQTQDFNEEKVKAMRAYLNELESFLIEGRKIFNGLIGEYQEDRKETERILRDIAEVIRMQNGIEQNSLEKAREMIQKYGEQDNNSTNTAALAEEIKALGSQLNAIETKDADLARQLEDLTEQRKAMLKKIDIIREDSYKALKIEPVYQQLSRLQENQEKIKGDLEELAGILSTINSIIQSHVQMQQGVQQLNQKIAPLLQEQQKYIHASAVHLRKLVAEGVLPKKMAA